MARPEHTESGRLGHLWWQSRYGLLRKFPFSVWASTLTDVWAFGGGALDAVRQSTTPPPLKLTTVPVIALA
jgi:hypothetical protein